MNDPSLAVLDVSTERGDSVTLGGSLCVPVLSGTATLARATIYTADPTAPVKQLSLVQGFHANTRAANAASDSGSRARSGIVDQLLSNLTFPGFHINLGDDVRLQTIGSDVINVKLASEGGLTVFRDPRFDPASAVPLPSTFKGIGLIGGLTSVTGTYTLLPPSRDPVPAAVECAAGGNHQFNGDPQPHDTNRRRHLGNHDRPRANGSASSRRWRGRCKRKLRSTLTSDQTYLSQSDLVSYLAIGQPAFALGGGVFSSSLSIFAPTGSALLSSVVRRGLGLDAISIEPGTSNTGTTSSDQVSSLFRNARLSGEKQLAGGFFFSFSTGLCAFKIDQFDANLFGQGLGGSLTYRFPDKRDSTGRSVTRWGAPSVRGSRRPTERRPVLLAGNAGLERTGAHAPTIRPLLSE